MSKILRDIPIERQLAKHIQWWEARQEEWNRQAQPSLRKPSKKPGPYISFSREHGSGGMEISRFVAEKLGWQHFDREIIESIAGRTHVREELVARFDEHIQGELQTYLYNLFTNQLLNNTQYLYHLTRVLTAIAHFGNAVIVGRGANLILPPEAGLRVRVVAPLPIRLKRLMDERGCDEASAAQEISKQDTEQRAFLNHHFRCKPDEPCSYDVVINTGYMELEAAVDFIIQMAEAKLKTTLAHKGQHAFSVE